MASFLDFINGLRRGGTAGLASATFDQIPTSTAANSAPSGSLTLGQNLANGGLAYNGTGSASNTGGTVDSGGTATYGSGGGGTYGTTAPDLSPYQNDIRSKIANIQSVYNGLNSNVDNIINERTNQYNQQYGQQLNNLQQGYQTTADQLGGAYNARGLGDSSFYGAAQQQAGDTYNQNLNSILQDKSNVLGQLGQYGASTKAGFDAAKNNYNDILNNLGSYDLSTLQGLQPQLQQAYGNVQAQSAGLGTNQQFLGELGKIAPQANQGTSQLASQLQQLITSGAPKFAKSQIAQGLIKQAQITDPGAVQYWNNYYNQLLNGGA